MNDTSPSPARTSPGRRHQAFHAGSFLLAALLLYLALRNADFATMWATLREADYIYLIPLILISLLSHWLRAWRWKILLQSLPEAQDRTPRIPHAFGALMIGYMVNYAAPRLGEVARSLVLSLKERLAFSSVLGTVVVERLLDVFTLFLAILSVLWLRAEAMGKLYDRLLAPLLTSALELPLWLTGLIVMLSAGLLLGAILWYRQKRATSSRLRTLWHHFLEGLLTLVQTPRKTLIVILTVAMWFCYLIMAYLPFVMFDYHHIYHLSLLDVWAIMILGSLGVAIPSPGGAGSYHYITIETLVLMFGVDASAAATYAVVTHAAQLVLYTILGGISLVLMDISWSTFRDALRKQNPEPYADTNPSPDASSDTSHHSHSPPGSRSSSL